MAATKDQWRLLKRCCDNEVPVFVLTGTDRCAMAALHAYMEEAVRLGCDPVFVADLRGNVIPDFETFQKEEQEKVKLPD